MAQLCKDYCGVLNEESLRLNFILVYELLDEVLVSNYTCTYMFPIVDNFYYMMLK